MDFREYVLEKALVIVPVLWIIGSFLKQTPFIKNWLIPWILTGVGIIGAIFLMGFSLEAVIQGVLVSGMAVLGHQLLTQSIKRDRP